MHLSPGTLHELPDDMISSLQQHHDVAQQRNALTPLARNEWICRVTIVKKQETRADHIARLLQDVGGGKKKILLPTMMSS